MEGRDDVELVGEDGGDRADVEADGELPFASDMLVRAGSPKR